MPTRNLELNDSACEVHQSRTAYIKRIFLVLSQLITKSWRKGSLQLLNRVRSRIYDASLSWQRKENYLEQLFTYELTDSNILFDDDSLLKKETNKSSLLVHLEKDWKNDDVLEESAEKKSFMSSKTEEIDQPCISMAVYGSYGAWSSPAIPYLTSNRSAFPVTREQGSLIVSLYNLGDLLGGLINPLFIDRIGRKYTLLLFTLPGLIGWMLIIFANNYVYLCIARFIAGVGQGSTFNSLVIYLTEISEKSIRGILVNMIHMAGATGVFVFTIVATYTSYNVLNFSSATLPIVFLLMFSFLPETPYYYLMKGQHDDAMKCLMKLRGISDPNKLTSEIQEMRLAIEEEKKVKTSNFWELINKSHNRRGLLILFFLKMTQLLSGVVAILSYAQEIFAKSNLPINPGVQVIILNGISLMACFGTNTVIERFNRRTLVLSTGLLASLCLGSVGLLFFMELYLKADVSSIRFLPLVALVCFQIVYMFGIGTIPYIVQGELFPINVKENAVACGMVMGSCFVFGTTAGYSVLSNAAGIYTTFFFFSTIALFGSLITFWIMPETKGRSLEEIQAMQNPRIKEILDSERKINKSLNS